MVLSLYQNCLLAIRNSVEDGSRLPMQKLPLDERKAVFNCFELHESLQEECFVRFLEEHSEFLEGFDQLVVEHSQTGHWHLFSAVLFQNFQRIPNLTRTIVKLSLQVRHWFRVDDANKKTIHETNYEEVCGIVGQCRSLKQLTLMDRVDYPEYRPQSSLLRRLTEVVDQGERIQLEELILKYIRDHSEFQAFTGPMFQSLRSLTLDKVVLTPITYRGLLAACHRHLGMLKLEQCQLGDDYMLPVPLPILESLYIASYGRRPSLFSGDFTMLAECPELRYVSVAIEPLEDDERVLRALFQLKAKVEISLGPTHLPDPISRIIERYGGNIVRLNLDNSDLTSDLVNLIVGNCTNLTCLYVSHRSPANVELTYSLLQAFLNDESRAMKLRELGTAVPNSAEVLRRVFETCRNITSLSLYPKDGRFDPASFMGLPDEGQLQLSEIRLANPTDLTDENLWPLLQRCGIRLKAIYVGGGFDEGDHKLTRVIYDMLFEHCRMVEDFKLAAYEDRKQQEILQQIADRKLFRKVIVT